MSFNTGYSYTRGLVYPVTGIVLHFGCFHVTVGRVSLAANPFYRDSFWLFSCDRRQRATRCESILP